MNGIRGPGLDLVLCVTYCSWFCSIFPFCLLFQLQQLISSLSPLQPAFNLINIHAEIFLFLLLLYELISWEADVWRVVLPSPVCRCCYSVFSVRAVWPLIKPTSRIYTSSFTTASSRSSSRHSNSQFSLFCVSVQDKNAFLGADRVWIIHFHIYMPELHNFTLHADMKSTGFWSGGFCRKLGV